MRRIACHIVTALLVLVALEARAGPAWLADKNGCRVWDLSPSPGESVSWNGPCAGGLADGKGVLQWSENGKPGDRFEGEYKAGHKSGHGVLVQANGDRYEGDWSNDVPSGMGVFVFAAGGRYEGNFADGRYNGLGIFVSAAGNRYEGEWKDGKKSGHGSLTWTNGDHYHGEFLDDLPNGQGTFLSNGQVYSGTWKSGCLREGYRRIAIGVEASKCR